MRTTELRILIATAGTLGDLLPFIALAQALMTRGHEVTIACATGLHSWVTRSGVAVRPFDGDFGKEQAQTKAENWDHWTRSPPAVSESRYRRFIDLIERNTRQLADLSRDADLLLTPTNCPEGKLAHQITGVPWSSVILMPEEAINPRPLNDPLLSEAMVEILRRLGIEQPYTCYEDYKKSRQPLFPCSRALGLASDPSIKQTGFWFYEDPEWSRWKPDPALLRFMEERDGDKRPLVLTFSSLPLKDPERVLELHVRAADLLGYRLVVQQGWAGFTPAMLPSGVDRRAVYMAEFLPHDWFFQRAAAVITHGGIGTIGRALRSGCPLFIEPYGNDQFFNALLVKRLGCGTAAHPHRLSPENLAEAIARTLRTGAARENARAAAHRIRTEDGVAETCALIEEVA